MLMEMISIYGDDVSFMVYWSWHYVIQWSLTVYNGDLSLPGPSLAGPAWDASVREYWFGEGCIDLLGPTNDGPASDREPFQVYSIWIGLTCSMINPLSQISR